MKIFLGNAPWDKQGHYGVRAGSRWPHFEHCSSPYMPFPFFLAYSTSLLEKNGFEVLLVDAIAEKINEEEYFKRMTQFAPDVVVHEVSTASFKTDLRQGGRVRELLPSAKVAFCGAHHGMYNTQFLDDTKFVDFVMEGEYEFALLDLAKSLRDGGDLGSVNGLLYRDEGKAFKNPRRELGQLDDLPWPARKYLPMPNYHDTPGDIPTPSLQLHASRGCPFSCVFCVWPQIMYGGNKYRVRNPEDVVNEIEWCKKEYGMKSFYFDDDTFNIGKKRILKLCDEIIKRKLNLPWAVMARADTADREMLEKMKEAGLVSIKYGVEAGDQEILNNSGKRLQLDKAEATIRDTIALGIKVHLTFTIGLPGETEETIEKTIKLAHKLNPDTVQFSIVTPFPGSKLYDDLKANGHLLSNDFDDYDGSNRAVIRTDALGPEQLEAALRRAYRGWFFKLFRKKIWSKKFHYLKATLKDPINATKTLAKLFIN